MSTPAPVRTLNDAAWCWWTQPRALVVGDSLVVGTINSMGEVEVTSVPTDGSQPTRRVLARLEADDHNNPAIVYARGKPTLCFYSRHDEEPFIRYRAGTAGLDDWGPERRVLFDDVTSYVQVHPVGDELVLLTRPGVTQWALAISSDWGGSWGPSRTFIALDTDQEVYLPTALMPDGKTLRVAIAGHPKDYGSRPAHAIWVCVIDLSSGQISLPRSGRVVGNIRTGEGLPLDQSSLELAYSCPPDRTLNLFDISTSPRMELAFATKRRDDACTEDAWYELATLGGQAWTVERIVPAGEVFGYIPAGMYVGGAAFPYRSPGGRLVVSREDGGQWHLEEFRNDGLAGWRTTPLVAPGQSRFVRPWPVETDGEPGYFVLELEHYDGSYMSTLSHLTGPLRP